MSRARCGGSTRVSGFWDLETGGQDRNPDIDVTGCHGPGALSSTFRSGCRPSTTVSCRQVQAHDGLAVGDLAAINEFQGLVQGKTFWLEVLVIVQLQPVLGLAQAGREKDPDALVRKPRICVRHNIVKANPPASDSQIRSAAGRWVSFS